MLEENIFICYIYMHIVYTSDIINKNYNYGNFLKLNQPTYK